MRAQRIASILLLGPWLAACASGATGAPTGGPADTSSASGTGKTAPTGTTTPPSDRITGPYVLTSKQTGGIAALQMVTVIDSNAKTISYGGPRNLHTEKRDLTDQEVASVTRVLNDAGLASFSGHLRGAAPADAFTYEIVLRSGGNTHTVSWTDGVTPPPPIQHLRTFLTRMRDEKFRGAPTKDAPVQ